MYKNIYPISNDMWNINDNIFKKKNDKVGIIVYGSLCKHLGELSSSVEKELYDGPILNISLNGCNKIKKNLTRILDYENGVPTNTVIKILKKNLTLDEIKNIILLREGKKDYISYYEFTTNTLHNIPNHLNQNIDDLKLKISKTCSKLGLDYLFFITYPPRIEDPILYVSKNYSILDDTKSYLKKCDSKTYSHLEKKILSL